MKNILVVDDNPDVVFSVMDGLKSVSREYRFLSASSGKEALLKLRLEKVDIVLLDIMMPQMDGWTVAANIKENPKTRDIPIMFLTAKNDDMSRELGSCAAEDFVEKPFDIRDLDRRIRKTLSLIKVAPMIR